VDRLQSVSRTEEEPPTLAEDRVERAYRDDAPRVWRAVYAYSGDPEIANDAVAEAFAQVLRRGDDVRDPLAWVWSAAFHVATDELRRRRRYGELPEDAGYELAEDSGRVFPEWSGVEAALAKLSPAQRAAVVLHYFGGFRLAEIAEIGGISKATVGVHLTRARRRLKKLLEVEHG
jgi:RNA polymerase sigma-70 factor, ECF subfamily